MKMKFGNRINSRVVVSAFAVIALVSTALLMSAAPLRAASDVKVEWMTWGFYRITSTGGKVILINPWYASPDGVFTPAVADLAGNPVRETRRIITSPSNNCAKNWPKRETTRLFCINWETNCCRPETPPSKPPGSSRSSSPA